MPTSMREMLARYLSSCKTVEKHLDAARVPTQNASRGTLNFKRLR